jgi:hypothetical protein
MAPAHGSAAETEAQRKRTAGRAYLPDSASGPSSEDVGPVPPTYVGEPGPDGEAAWTLPRWAKALGRLAGFLLLALPALAILAAVVLLPEYTAWKNDVYQRDLAAAQTADLQSLKEAQERMLMAAYDDVVFIKRLAMWNCNLLPSNEQILDSRMPEGPPPGVVVGEPHPRPAKPDDPLIRAAAKIADSPGKDNAPLRRGLFIVSAGLMIFAGFFFAPSPRRSSARATA